MAKHQRQSSLPSWLLGLLIAVVIFAVSLFLLDYFGYGDDPVIDQDTSAAALLL
jgi:ABC-type dipeptide/oligopeptide/nickel transport system permease component